MRYDISKRTAPEMPNLGKGTECIKLLLSQASKDMHEPLVPMLFPSLAAHISGNPLLRACISLSATPVTARAFYKNELHNGTFGRMVFSYKPREANRSGRIPRKGEFADDFYKQFDTYLARLQVMQQQAERYVANKRIDSLKLVKKEAEEYFNSEATVEYNSNRQIFDDNEALTATWNAVKETYTRISTTDIISKSLSDMIFKIITAAAMVFIAFNMVMQKLKIKKQLKKAQTTQQPQEELPSI